MPGVKHYSEVHGLQVGIVSYVNAGGCTDLPWDWVEKHIYSLI